MSAQIIYRPFCHVNIWHGYYLHPGEWSNNELEVYNNDPDIPDQMQIIESLPKHYSILNDLRFFPVGDSLQLMNDGKMLFREHQNGFSIWIRAKAISDGLDQTLDPKYKPSVPMDLGFKLIIPFRLQNWEFVNFTNIGMNGTSRGIYYFSNKAGNPHYETIGAENKLLSLFLNDKEAPQHYISEKDRIPICNNVRIIDVTNLQLKFVRFDITSKDDPSHRMSITFTAQDVQDFLETCKIHLINLPSGVYEQKAYTLEEGVEVEIPGLQEIFYLNTGDISADTFGIIELFHLADGSLGEYGLLNDRQQLQCPTYTLWWQNRMTKWRYIFNHEQPIPDETNGDVKFETADKKQLITKTEQPLLHNYRKIRYRLVDPGSTEEFSLPNPGTDRIYPDRTSNQVYSEVRMGNIMLNKI